MLNRTVVCLMACLMAGALVTGCKPTYKTGAAHQAIVEMCEKEYNVRVSVQTNGKTIGVFIPSINVLKSDLSFSDHVLEKIEHVMLTVTRVTLSSETQYDFFVVSTRDVRTGVQISFVRYIKDIRRMITDDISRTDFFQRMIIDAEVVPTNSSYVLKSYSIQEFLAAQLGERLRQDLEMNLVAARLFRLENIEGSFAVVPSETGHGQPTKLLRMTLYFHPDAPAFESVGTSVLRDDFTRLFLHTAQLITRRYEFNDFDGMELVERTGRRLAFFERKEFTRDTVNTLMELIRSLKEKTK